MAGPPIAFYYLAGRETVTHVRANLTTYFVFVDLVAIATFVVRDLVDWNTVVLGLFLAPAVMLGGVLGARLFPLASEEFLPTPCTCPAGRRGDRRLDPVSGTRSGAGMKIWDRIVEAVTRLANGGSFGSLLGLTSPPADDGAHPGLRQIAFTIGVIALGAKMARVDGEVSEVEAAAFRDFFQVPPGEERNVERFFNLAKRDVAGFETYARQLAALFPDAPEILENVLEGLFSIGKADGPIDVAEAAYLAEVSQIFGLSSARFERAKAAALGVVECEPCTILGIDPLATDEQIRDAWLRQVKANHPDRLMAQGLPEEAIAMANRKLALINDAYDRLRRERGLVPA